MVSNSAAYAMLRLQECLCILALSDTPATVKNTVGRCRYVRWVCVVDQHSCWYVRDSAGGERLCCRLFAGHVVSHKYSSGGTNTLRQHLY